VTETEGDSKLVSEDDHKAYFNFETGGLVRPYVLDPGSIAANRLGRLSPAQIRKVYRGTGGLALNAMFAVAIGGMFTYALPNPALRILLGLITAALAVYMLSRSYDAFLDIRGNRVAAITGHVRLLTTREEGMQRCEIGGRAFWVPSSALAMLSVADAIVYFVPRSNIVVNIEPASGDSN
jgi:hypothetical protein